MPYIPAKERKALYSLILKMSSETSDALLNIYEGDLKEAYLRLMTLNRVLNNIIKTCEESAPSMKAAPLVTPSDVHDFFWNTTLCTYLLIETLKDLGLDLKKIRELELSDLGELIADLCTIEYATEMMISDKSVAPYLKQVATERIKDMQKSYKNLSTYLPRLIPDKAEKILEVLRKRMNEALEEFRRASRKLEKME